jgi:integrase
MALTDATLKALKPQAGKTIKISDGGGLFVQLAPGGGSSRLWRFAYRWEGRQKLLSGGRYPDVPLAAARRWRDMVREQLAAGIDPSVARMDAAKAAKVAASNSFEAVARDWHEARKNQISPRYADIVLSRLETYAFPVIGKLAVTSIDAPTLLDMIRRIEKGGALDVANRVRAYSGRIFRFAISEGRGVRDPSRDITDAQQKGPPTTHRARVAIDQMPFFWQRFHADECAPMTANALRWTLMTACRTGEVRHAAWSEIEGLAGPKPIWRIPANRMKGDKARKQAEGFDHLVPLTPQMIELLKQIRELSHGSKWLFPVPGTRSGVISANRMLDALARQGWRGKVGHATVHGFRGLFSTFLNEATRVDDRGIVGRMWESDWIERQLGHVAKGVRASYNSAEYIDARRLMLEYWNTWLADQEMIGTVIG